MSKNFSSVSEKSFFFKGYSPKDFLKKQIPPSSLSYLSRTIALKGVGEDTFGKNRGLVERGDVTPNPGG